MRRAMAMLGMVFLVGGAVWAQDAVKEPTSQPSVVDATDTGAVDGVEGKGMVTVQGKIIQCRWSKSGKVLTASFLPDEDTLQLVIFSRDKDDMDKTFGGDVAAAMDGATVKVEGKVKDYKGRPEIIISKTDQLTIVTSAASQPTSQP